MKGVIIGSYALKQYDQCPPSITPSDIDIIVTKEIAFKFILDCKEKRGNMFWFDGLNLKVDLIFAEKDESDLMILDYCNKNSLKTIQLLGMEFIIAPLDLLYVIKKSHIHRMIANNVDIWRHQMKMYDTLKSIVDHNNLEYLFYRNEKKLGEIDYSENELLLRQIYFKRFDETTKRVGDTSISLDKKEDDFFTDGVVRYIDHDALHELIALLCRSSKDLIFKKFQDDENSVGLSEIKFKQAPYSEQIQMLLEEIMVLLVERKLIPCLIKIYKEEKRKFTGFNAESMNSYLNDITAHFVTNLCGQSHYWLRRYCLNHFFQISDASKYNFKELEILACEIADMRYDACEEIITLDSIKGSIEKTLDENLKIFSNFEKNSKYSNEFLKIKFGSGDSFVDYKCFKIVDSSDWYSSFKLTPCLLSISNNLIDSNDVAKDFLKKMVGKKIIDNSDDSWITIIDIDNNIGLFLNKFGWKVFCLGFKTEGYGRFPQFYVFGKFIDLEHNGSNKFEVTNQKKFKTCVYYSYDCTENSGRSETTHEYLSSFGTCPYFLNKIVESISRIYLNVLRDEGNDCYNKHEEEDDY